MPPVLKTIVNLAIWILFIKSLLIVGVTIYTFSRAYLAGGPSPMVEVAACAAGTFSFTMACVAVMIRKKLD